MAYSTSNPPVLLVPAPMHSGAQQIWGYSSADTDADIDGTDYISNGSALGMRAGDIVFVRSTESGPARKSWIHVVISVTAGGAATLNGTANAAALTES